MPLFDRPVFDGDTFDPFLDGVRAAHRAEVDAAVARASTPTASNYLNVDALRERVEFLEKHAAQREAAHAEAVRVAVEAEGRLWDQACADVRDRTAEVWDIDGVAALCHDGEDAEAVRVVVKHRRAAAIRARGAKS